MLAATAALAVGAAGAEVAVRAATRLTGACHPLCITEYDTTLGWTNSRGASGRHRNPSLGIDVVYRIDGRGARAMSSSSGDSLRPFRVLVLGDSNGFGWGVPDDQHFAALLQQALPQTDVLNLAVSGYGTDQSYLRLRSEAMVFSPHLIIVQITPNDLDDIQSAFIAGRPKPRFLLDAGGLRLSNVPVRLDEAHAHEVAGVWLPIAARDWLLRRSYTYHWINGRFGTPDRTRDRFTAASGTLFRSLLSAIRRAAAEARADLLLVHASPELSTRAMDIFPPDAPVLDLSQRFQRESALFADELHWNARGHAIVSEEVARWMRARSSGSVTGHSGPGAASSALEARLTARQGSNAK
jgi:lysophospholipase L1-like esterase